MVTLLVTALLLDEILPIIEILLAAILPITCMATVGVAVLTPTRLLPMSKYNTGVLLARLLTDRLTPSLWRLVLSICPAIRLIAMCYPSWLCVLR